MEGRKKKRAWEREKRGEVKKKLIELNEEINIGRDEKIVGERKRVNRDFKERTKIEKGRKETKSELE